jgi:hypothetical protein
MKLLHIINYALSLGLIGILTAGVDPDIAKFSKEVFKGGRVYDETEIRDVSAHKDWSDHHRAILEVQMLASAGDPKSYQRAIDIASNYIATGKNDWARNFIRMQRGFVHMLNGQQDKGLVDLEDLVNRNAFDGIEKVHDPILDSIRIRQRNLETYFNDVMRQDIGHHYLDFRKEGAHLEKAYHFFIGIKSAKLREECMAQLRDRLGDGYEEKIQSFEKNFIDSQRTEGSTGSHDRKLRRELSHGSQRKDNKAVPPSAENSQSERATSFLPLLMLFLIIVVAIGAIIVLRSKR